MTDLPELADAGVPCKCRETIVDPNYYMTLEREPGEPISYHHGVHACGWMVDCNDCKKFVLGGLPTEQDARQKLALHVEKYCFVHRPAYYDVVDVYPHDVPQPKR